MREQDSAAMLDALHELPVGAGDAIFVPAGMPHAIGAGILLVELQEPTDLSVLLEWDGFELTEAEGHLDLGWDRALGGPRARAVEPPGRVLPEEAAHSSAASRSAAAPRSTRASRSWSARAGRGR